MLMLSTRNILTPRNGKIIIGAHQAFTTGSYSLSNKDNFCFTRSDFGKRLSTQMLVEKDQSLRIDWPHPIKLEPGKLWTGKQVLSVVLCPNKAKSAVEDACQRKESHKIWRFMREWFVSGHTRWAVIGWNCGQEQHRNNLLKEEERSFVSKEVDRSFLSFISWLCWWLRGGSRLPSERVVAYYITHRGVSISI